MNSKSVNRVLKRAEALCRQRGVRLTDQRKTVLRLLCVSDKPLSAYELLDRMRAEAEAATDREALAGVTGIRDTGLLNSLLGTGVRAENVAALTVIPLVFVAWADHRMVDVERRAVLAGLDREVAQLPGIGAPVVELVDVVGVVDVGVLVGGQQPHAVQTHVAAVELAERVARTILTRARAAQQRQQAATVTLAGRGADELGERREQVEEVVQEVESAVQRADVRQQPEKAEKVNRVLKKALDQASASNLLASETGANLSQSEDYNLWLDRKLRQSLEWLSQADRDKVSIQVLMRSKSAARELVYYLRNEWPLDISKTYLYEVSTEDRSIYRVFYSEFDSLTQGRDQLEQLPDSVKVNSPYLHSVHRMQKALL